MLLLEQSDEWSHAEQETFIDDCIVERDTFLVDGVFTSAHGYNSGPS